MLFTTAFIYSAILQLALIEPDCLCKIGWKVPPVREIEGGGKSEAGWLVRKHEGSREYTSGPSEDGCTCAGWRQIHVQQVPGRSDAAVCLQLGVNGPLHESVSASEAVGHNGPGRRLPYNNAAVLTEEARHRGGGNKANFTARLLNTTSLLLNTTSLLNNAHY